MIVAVPILLIFSYNFHPSKCNTIQYFRIRECSYELHPIERNHFGFLRIPLQSMEIFLSDEINLFECNITDRIYHIKSSWITIKNYNSFLCQNLEVPDTIDHRKLLVDIASLNNVNSSRKTISNGVVDSLQILNTLPFNATFNSFAIDIIIDVCYQNDISYILFNNNFSKILFRIAQTMSTINNELLRDVTSELAHLDYLIPGYPKDSLITKVIDQNVYIKGSELKVNYISSILTAKITKKHIYMTLTGFGASMKRSYSVIIRKVSVSDSITCKVWFQDRDYDVTKTCTSTNMIVGWTTCHCETLGVVTINISNNIEKLRGYQYELDDVIPNTLSVVKVLMYEKVQVLEKQYRFEKASNYLFITTILICTVSVVLILFLLIFYKTMWSHVSSTNRQFLCLLSLLWLNVLILQPQVIRYFKTVTIEVISSEYIVWGIMSLHSICAYTFMLGGTQVVLFMAGVNSQYLTCRFCDLTVALVVIVCCCIPFLMIMILYKVAVVSINKSVLLPMNYGAGYFVLAPLSFVILISFILSAASCFLPKRGGGTFLLTVIYPLIFLHGFCFYHVMTMENLYDYDYLNYFYYACGVFIQSIYLLMWLIIVIILPAKSITIFGKRDSSFRMEFIYMIKLKEKSGKNVY